MRGHAVVCPSRYLRVGVTAWRGRVGPRSAHRAVPWSRGGAPGAAGAPGEWAGDPGNVAGPWAGGGSAGDDQDVDEGPQGDQHQGDGQRGTALAGPDPVEAWRTGESDGAEESRDDEEGREEHPHHRQPQGSGGQPVRRGEGRRVAGTSEDGGRIDVLGAGKGRGDELRLPDRARSGGEAVVGARGGWGSPAGRRGRLVTRRDGGRSGLARWGTRWGRGGCMHTGRGCRGRGAGRCRPGCAHPAGVARRPEGIVFHWSSPGPAPSMAQRLEVPVRVITGSMARLLLCMTSCRMGCGGVPALVYPEVPTGTSAQPTD